MALLPSTECVSIAFHFHQLTLMNISAIVHASCDEGLASNRRFTGFMTLLQRSNRSIIRNLSLSRAIVSLYLEK
jgi:hypothetical protein